LVGTEDESGIGVGGVGSGFTVADCLLNIYIN
jgi:hypothetical protein